jgi:hypothetical protein
METPTHYSADTEIPEEKHSNWRTTPTVKAYFHTDDTHSTNTSVYYVYKTSSYNTAVISISIK